MRRRNEEGFTLLELMIVVAILGSLAVAAIPTYVHYVRKSRTVEVVESLGKIAHGAKSYFGAHQKFPENSGDWAPTMTHATSCANSTGLFHTDTIPDWDKPTWTGLLFQPTAPYRYRYKWTVVNPGNPSDANVLAKAAAYGLGDLDCDGIPSVWIVHLRELAGMGSLQQTGPTLFSGLETE